jgi:hypothetical protein
MMLLADFLKFGNVARELSFPKFHHQKAQMPAIDFAGHAEAKKRPGH